MWHSEWGKETTNADPLPVLPSTEQPYDGPKLVRLTAPAGVLRAEYGDGSAWWYDSGYWVRDTSRGWDALG